MLKVKLEEKDFHPHLKSRMAQRGVGIGEIEKTLSEGRDATDTKVGTFGKVLVFVYNNEWEGNFFQEKEVTVYYKIIDDRLVLLTVKTRYGEKFSQDTEE